jgi:hypothetical protein
MMVYSRSSEPSQIERSASRGQPDGRDVVIGRLTGADVRRSQAPDVVMHGHESMSQRRRAECRHSNKVRAEKNDKSDDFNGKAHGAAIITSSAALSMVRH